VILSASMNLFANCTHYLNGAQEIFAFSKIIAPLLIIRLLLQGELYKNLNVVAFCIIIVVVPLCSNWNLMRLFVSLSVCLMILEYFM